MGNGEKGGRFAAVLCLLPALYLIAIVIYAVLNSAEYASGIARITRYVLVPGFMALCLLFVALRVKGDTRLVVGICASSLFATLFAFEAYLTVKSLPARLGMFGVVSKTTETGQFRQNIPPAYTIKRLNNEKDIQTLDAAMLSPLTEGDIFLCSLNGQPVSYQPDRYGFRNPDTVHDGGIDVMLLGDSFAEGFCLEDGHDLASQLRKDIPQLMNTGHRGAGPLFELAVLGRYGPYFKPDVTVMAFFAGNDWKNLQREEEMPWLAPALESGTDFGVIAHSEAQIEAARQHMDQWWDGTTLSWRDYLRKQRVFRNFFALQKTTEVLGLHYPKAAEPNPVYGQVLKRAAEMVEQWGGELVVVYIPTISRFVGMLPQDFVHDPLRNMVRDAATQADLQMIDLTEVFEAADEPRLMYAADAHFNEKGATVAAETIVQSLRQRGLLN
ncbi:GDSL-type esterase/lipase family protein [Roseibium sp. RKSG952]|uniref:GDSL-type esterase/lipase family protein n=1 Tax=Roseibium sp. RKSG952 TaxID=2529384 RepID=UPI0012BB5E96|nr:GDSL-type esterase/lipase family protein [Roseibium sp. RKSG952]MTI00869.1 SGNH/GDSL hydrolase family protein [Roseibium sp. RKSG952]